MYSEEQIKILKRITLYCRLTLAGFWIFVITSGLEIFFEIVNALFLNYKTEFQRYMAFSFTSVFIPISLLLFSVGYGGITFIFRKDAFLEIYDNLDIPSIAEKHLNKLEILFCNIGRYIYIVGLFGLVLIIKAISKEFEEQYGGRRGLHLTLSCSLSIITALFMSYLFAMHCITGHEQRVQQFEKAKAMFDEADEVFCKYNAEDSHTFGFDKSSLDFSLSEYWNYCKDDEYLIRISLDKNDFLVSTLNMDFDFDDSKDREKLYDDFIEEFDNATSAFKETDLEFQYSEMDEGLILPEDFKENFMNTEEGTFKYRYELSEHATVYIDIERNKNYEGNKYIKISYTVYNF